MEMHIMQKSMHNHTDIFAIHKGMKKLNTHVQYNKTSPFDSQHFEQWNKFMTLSNIINITARWPFHNSSGRNCHHTCTGLTASYTQCISWDCLDWTSIVNCTNTKWEWFLHCTPGPPRNRTEVKIMVDEPMYGGKRTHLLARYMSCIFFSWNLSKDKKKEGSSLYIADVVQSSSCTIRSMFLLEIKGKSRGMKRQDLIIMLLYRPRRETHRLEGQWASHNMVHVYWLKLISMITKY